MGCAIAFISKFCLETEFEFLRNGVRMREIWPSEVSENFRIENSSKFEFKPRSGLGGKFPTQDPGRLGGRLGSRPPQGQVDHSVDQGVDLPPEPTF